jgi:GntR family transcriptional repressor for pyruvate dehydrogenase complex
VLSHIEDELAGGTLQLGGKLPAERSLAETLGVSRASIREAIRVLEAMGVVQSAVGSGPDAGTVVVANSSAALSSALRLHVASGHLPIADVVATRVLLETHAVSQAAIAVIAANTGGTGGTGNLEEAQRVLAAMADRELSVTAFVDLDAQFHLAIARAGGNAVLSSIMESLRESIQAYVLAAVPTVPDWHAEARRLHREHRAILQAIAAGEDTAAVKKVRAHIEGFYRRSGFVGQTRQGNGN